MIATSQERWGQIMVVQNGDTWASLVIGMMFTKIPGDQVFLHNNSKDGERYRWYSSSPRIRAAHFAEDFEDVQFEAKGVSIQFILDLVTLSTVCTSSRIQVVIPLLSHETITLDGHEAKM